MNETASGDNIGKRAFHSAVLTRDSKILIYGGSTILIYGGSKPGPAILDTSVYPFRWKSLYVKSFIAAPLPSLVSHSCIIYDDFMVIAFGRFTVEDQETLNNHVYIFDTISYKWVTTFDRNTPVPLYVIVLPIVAVIALIAFAICRNVKSRDQIAGFIYHMITINGQAVMLETRIYLSLT
ncbi:7626_t:CDS:2, partial [Gigaspora margarita]